MRIWWRKWGMEWIDLFTVKCKQFMVDASETIASRKEIVGALFISFRLHLWSCCSFLTIAVWKTWTCDDACTIRGSPTMTARENLKPGHWLYSVKTVYVFYLSIHTAKVGASISGVVFGAINYQKVFGIWETLQPREYASFRCSRSLPGNLAFSIALWDHHVCSVIAENRTPTSCICHLLIQAKTNSISWSVWVYHDFRIGRILTYTSWRLQIRRLLHSRVLFSIT